MTALAKQAGLDDDKAQKFAGSNLNTDKSEWRSALNNAVEQDKAEKLQREIDQLKGISSHSYPEGSITHRDGSGSKSISNALTNENISRNMVYNQKYSVIIGNYNGQVSYNNNTGYIFSDNRVTDINVKGLKTEISAIPTEGTATYTGKAFNGTLAQEYKKVGTEEWFGSTRDKYDFVNSSKEGNLSYKVNFADKTGSGSITGLGNDIALAQGSISGAGISSTATQSYKSGSYSLDFFGKNAEEIGGKVSFDGKGVVGFGGTRGEITK